MRNLLEGCRSRANRDSRAARGLLRIILPHHPVSGASRPSMRIRHFDQAPNPCGNYLLLRNDVCRIPIFIFEVRRNKVTSTNRTT
jgi:hypothetical protein